ncbi:ABC transporter substrate-binding protein [Dactylosporangium sp. CA-233914]|uniref:ABC transporter substrate-binding protein n=1 Tax=Dactylosporangium sp. CA-233914 TaxID=3239934 RepID=UPI003D8D78EF
MTGIHLGIDYGTSNTVAVLRWPDGRGRTLLFDSSPLLPSGVFATVEGPLLVGRDAERAARADPGRFEPNPKRRIDELEVLLGNRVHSVAELVAAVLHRVVAEARRVVGGPVDRVTLTHPVAWGPARRRVLVEAARMAGLPTPRLLAEPVAAAGYFTAVLGNRVAPGQCLVVYDLGAGTFDASVVQHTGTGFETLAYRGIDDIGGLDLDALIVSHIGAALAESAPQAWQTINDPGDPAGRYHRLALWNDAREAREALTRQSAATIYVAAAQRDVIVTREEFERAATGLLHKTIATTLATVREARVRPDSIVGWFLVGGATRTPLVATMLLRASGQPATVLDEPQLVVADGAVHAIPAGPEDAPVSVPQPAQPPSSPVNLPHQALTITPAAAPASPAAVPVSPAAAPVSPAVAPASPAAVPVSPVAAASSATAPPSAALPPMAPPTAPFVAQVPNIGGPGFPAPPPQPPADITGGIRPSGTPRSRRWLVVGLAASAVVLVLAGLPFLTHLNGDDDKADSGSNGPSGPSSATGGPPAFNAAINGVVNPSDKKGGKLKLVVNSEPDSFDPVRTYYAWVWNFGKGYYVRSLLTNQAKPGQDGLKLVPDLATALPAIEDGGKKYTFKLKDNIKFEDGSPITSKDIKYGIERIFAQDVLAGGPTYLMEALDQGQSYPGPYKDTDPNKLGLKSVQTPDDKTIVFTLAKPLADFPYLLAMPTAGPVPAAKDTGEKYGEKPVSSGPYKFQSYEAGKKAVLVRNDKWDPATDTVRMALPDEIDLTIGAAPADIDDQLISGTADIDVGQIGVQPDTQARILQNAANKRNADAPNTGYIRFFSISTKVAPFDNVHCRKAVQYATDKVAMQNARGGPDAGGDIAINMLPPGIAGYDPKLDPYNTKSGKPQIDKAKEELALCGKPNGFDTVIASRNTGKEPISATALQEALKKVGINATLDQTDPSVYFRSTIGSPSNVHAKGYGLMMAAWGADIPTGYGFLSMLVDGRQTPPANNNYAELNNSEINRLIDKATDETDPQNSAAIWGQINTIVMDEAVMVPFVYDKALNYRNPRLKNVFVNNYYGMYDFGSLGVI